MIIDNLDKDTVGVEKIVDKINEIIDAINRFEGHYHMALDTHYYTSLPRFPNDDDKVDDE